MKHATHSLNCSNGLLSVSLPLRLGLVGSQPWSIAVGVIDQRENGFLRRLATDGTP